MHLGIVLPSFRQGASARRIREVAETAEELGFTSVWALEHFVGPVDGPEVYQVVMDPIVTLGWIAGWTERIRLATGVVMLPLHNPFQLAKQAATVQQLSSGRFNLGIGLGWYEPEFELMQVPFAGRGERADDALRVMRALWNGETSCEGTHWHFDDAIQLPKPEPLPEVWIGGDSKRAVRRAVEFGDVWFPSNRSTTDDVAQAKEMHPDLPIVPMVAGTSTIDSMLEAGAEGAVVWVEEEFNEVAVMRQLAARYL